MQQSILIILHQEHSTPGRVGNALRELGYRLDVRRPRFGDELPQTMADHSAGIIFGGPMSANDQDDFIRREIDWIAVIVVFATEVAVIVALVATATVVGAV